MTKIVIAESMESEVVEEIRKLGTVVYKPANLSSELHYANVLIVRSSTKVTADLIKDASSLKIVARAGVGLDNVDVKSCEAKGIKVMNTPLSSGNAVAELVIGLMISMLRNIPRAHLQMKNKIWDKQNLIGNEISGKTLGVIGYGRIGSMVGEKAHALGMPILAFDPSPRQLPNVKFVDLDTLFKSADVITLHVALTDQTRDLIGKENIAKMKNGVFIVNTSRGEVIDEDALYDACKSKKIAGATLDVYKKNHIRENYLN